MKVSLNLLRQLVELPPALTDTNIAGRLTQAGLEVEGQTVIGAEIAGVIVAEVRGKRRHPKADKLTLVDVFDGERVTQVVCGAPNVPEPAGEDQEGGGPRVLWARPGARLPGGVTLAEREVRGVVSPGMLCAEDELGLSEDHAGILVLRPEDGLAIGSDFRSGAGLPDTVLELNVTANRPDCLGHLGVARELAALFSGEGARLRPTDGAFGGVDLWPWLARGADVRGPQAEAPGGLSLQGLEIQDKVGCPRYLARVLHGLRVGPSPLPLRLLLQRLGLRAISNLVDATNLSMLLFGQPLHAFDLARLRGGRVVVRGAAAGEVIKTLDGVVRTLVPEDLVIADGERPLALAGVMGGEDSEVTAQTREVLLEAAYFDPATVRRSARRLKMHTEASHRFERGVDPNEGLARASHACAALLVALGGPEARLDAALVDEYPQVLAPKTVTLRPGRTAQLLGVAPEALPAEEQARLLQALGLAVQAEGEALVVQVPTARPDLTREVDLIEEVARLHGYDHLPPRLPRLRLGEDGGGGVGQGSAQSALSERARDLCAALGLDEIQSFSFVAPERIAALGFGAEDARARPLLLHNPLREELSALRTQLVVGLLDALRHNLSHGLRDLRLFEVGEVFLPQGPGQPPREVTRVAGVLAGTRAHWLKPAAEDALDFFDVRGVVDALLAALGHGSTEEGRGVRLRAPHAGEAPWLHPGVSALVEQGTAEESRVLGALGELHPELRQRLGIEVRAFAFELDLPSAVAPAPRFAPLARFPEVTRDLSFFIDAAVPAGQVLAALRGGGQALLHEVRVVEDYREAGRVPAGKKGLLLSLTYRSLERTLVDEEVQQAHDALVAALRGAFPVELR